MGRSALGRPSLFLSIKNSAMVLLHPDPDRPKPAYKTALKSSGKAAPFLEGLDWVRSGENWGVVAWWPTRFVAGEQNSQEDPKDLFSLDFATGAYLDKWTDIFLGEDFWAGTAHLKKGPLYGSSYKIPGGKEWDELRAQVGDQVNAIFQDAHARGRWDLLDIWYPLVWDRMAQAEVPWVIQGAAYLGYKWLEIGTWPGYPELDKQRAKLQDLYDSGTAKQWAEKIHAKRTADKLPTPPWMGPYLAYRPYWWIVPNMSSGGVQAWIPESHQVPGRWIPSHISVGFKSTWKKIEILYPLDEITQSDKIKDVAFSVAFALAASVMLGAFAEGAWASLGAPEAPLITDALASGLQAEISGGDFTDALLDSLLPDIGEAVSAVGGSDFLSAAADLAAGNTDTENIMGVLDSFTDGLGWLDDAVADASGFLDDISGLTDGIESFSDLFGGSAPSGSGGVGYPSAPPVLGDQEASGSGVFSTQVSPAQKSQLSLMIPLLAIGALLVLK